MRWGAVGAREVFFLIAPDRVGAESAGASLALAARVAGCILTAVSSLRAIFWAAAFSLVLWCGGVRAEEGATALVWRLDQVEKIGGRVAEMIGAPRVRDGAVVFDGERDGLLVSVNPLAGLKEFTVEVWFCPAEDGPPEQRFWHAQDAAGSRALLETRLDGMGSWWLDTYLLQVGKEGRPLIDPKRKHATEKWYWVALRYDGKTMAHFVNGEKEREGEVEFGPTGEGRTSLGVRQNRIHWFKGAIREVRVTPAALADEKLQRVK